MTGGDARAPRAVRVARYRAAHPSDTPLLVLLCCLAVFIAVLVQVLDPAWVPPSALILPLLGGALVLRLRPMAMLTGVVIASYLAIVIAVGAYLARPGALVVILAGAALSLALARARDALGVPGLRGEAMLLELRGRLRQQGQLPPLPAGWAAEVVQRSAGGAGFGGDFVVSTLLPDVERLEVALVDVSGKGFEAGTRALLLSGALGGLLGAVRPEEFLTAANRYLCDREWGEGFATAVHVAVDLRTGEYLMESAGHPPAAHFSVGSGQWRLSTIAGTVLGLVPEATFRQERGVLRRGDALLLYTDGLVEVPGRDLTLGIDQLLGEANRLVVTSFEGGAERLMTALGGSAMDDRALVLLWRA